LTEADLGTTVENSASASGDARRRDARRQRRRRHAGATGLLHRDHHHVDHVNAV